MRETCEFRIDGNFVDKLFDKHEGKVLGDNFIRLIEIDVTDPRYVEIGRLQKEMIKKTGKPFFFGWHINRYYSDEELSSAALLHLKITSFINSAGEDCGTTYDESKACNAKQRRYELKTRVNPRRIITQEVVESCGAGAVQSSELQLELNKIPKKNDISRTIAGEIVVSARLADLLKKEMVSGVSFGPVYSCHNKNKLANNFLQLFPNKCDIEIIPPSKFGTGPFDDDKEGRYRCDKCNVLGLVQLSELWVKEEMMTGLEIRASRQFSGVRRGLLRPERAIFISPQLWRLLEINGIKGYEIEVVHFR